MEKDILLRGRDGRKVMWFWGSAFGDYLSSRQLLINYLLPQACALANTSIEKYFKAMKAMYREPVPKHHDITVSRFQNTIQNKFPELYKIFNF